jgi:predicted nuclease of predicted toxin-antitoxin system
MTEDQILEDFPELTQEDINACFAFAGRPRAEALRGAGVKLLLDENLSDRITLFPDSKHIKAVGLREAEDFVVWEWAKKHGVTIVSKDIDFHQRAIVFGHPPKIIWLRVGSCETSLITNLLRSRYQLIRQFIESETESLLVLERLQANSVELHARSAFTFLRGSSSPEHLAFTAAHQHLHHDLSSKTRRRGCSKIEHFVDRELKATLGNKRVDREHRQSTSRVGKGRVGERYLVQQLF